MKKLLLIFVLSFFCLLNLFGMNKEEGYFVSNFNLICKYIPGDIALKKAKKISVLRSKIHSDLCKLDSNLDKELSYVLKIKNILQRISKLRTNVLEIKTEKNTYFVDIVIYGLNNSESCLKYFFVCNCRGIKFNEAMNTFPKGLGTPNKIEKEYKIWFFEKYLNTL
jgi:hypothetical protein